MSENATTPAAMQDMSDEAAQDRLATPKPIANQPYGKIAWQ